MGGGGGDLLLFGILLLPFLLFLTRLVMNQELCLCDGVIKRPNESYCWVCWVEVVYSAYYDDSYYYLPFILNDNVCCLSLIGDCPFHLILKILEGS